MWRETLKAERNEQTVVSSAGGFTGSATERVLEQRDRQAGKARLSLGMSARHRVV